nr:MAG TPA: hypothetical protein [Caudoviricetes sp.]
MQGAALRGQSKGVALQGNAGHSTAQVRTATAWQRAAEQGHSMALNSAATARHSIAQLSEGEA